MEKMAIFAFQKFKFMPITPLGRYRWMLVFNFAKIMKNWSLVYKIHTCQLKKITTQASNIICQEASIIQISTSTSESFFSPYLQATSGISAIFEMFTFPNFFKTWCKARILPPKNLGFVYFSETFWKMIIIALYFTLKALFSLNVLKRLFWFF